MSQPARLPRILLVRDGDFFIHVSQLALLLKRHGCDVEVLCSANAAPEPLYRDLIESTRAGQVPCHVVIGRGSALESKLLAAAFTLRLIAKRNVITPHKIRESLKTLAARPPFDLIIAIDAPSLFLAHQLFRTELHRVMEYSLEISDESHRDFQTSRTERRLRFFERSVLPKLAGLIIQDRFRAEVLLARTANRERVRVIHFPVAMSGPGRLKTPPQRAVKVIFFGGLWSGDFLNELHRIADRLRPEQSLLIRGGRGTMRPQVSSQRVDLSAEPIPFDKVNDVIAAADIGIALYPNDEANSRCSAFASEKVARYLQCGLPFIAFRSDDYLFLQEQTGCCELVSSYADVPAAVNTIVDHYERYARGAASAFARFYSHDTTGPALVRELLRSAS
jgi:hypothetical protein